MIDYYYGLLKTRDYAPSNEAMTEIRMVRRMAENHLEDFLDSIIGQFLGDISNAVTSDMFIDLCKHANYMLIDSEVFRRKFIVWCISS